MKGRKRPRFHMVCLCLWSPMATRSFSVPTRLSRLKMSTDSRQLRFFQSPVVGSSDSSFLNVVLPLRSFHADRHCHIQLTDDEEDLFELLRNVQTTMGLDTTLRVAGGWVRDKLLATQEFQNYHQLLGNGRLTSKFRPAAVSLGRLGTKVLVTNNATHTPVDIDIALDDMLGREFADTLNAYLHARGHPTSKYGMVLQNPEKSKHLETATMKVGKFWVDFVNLRHEEYTQNSRIPDLMRIGTPAEDAFRRDLTINALFYNINTGTVEDFTGKGFEDLKRGVVATPLPALTTLLDDPLRVLRSIRFAARLRFTMDNELVQAAKTPQVSTALSQKVSRERIGGELDLMLRSPDPVGAVRLLMNLNLIHCVFPLAQFLTVSLDLQGPQLETAVQHQATSILHRGLALLSTTHDHVADCRCSPPLWCVKAPSLYGTSEIRLVDDEESRRLLWYSALLKPLHDTCRTTHTGGRRSKKSNRSVITKLLVDELKRPGRDAEHIETILRAADDFRQLLAAGCDVSATMILLSKVQVTHQVLDDALCDVETTECATSLHCYMQSRKISSATEDDPVWEHAMEFRLLCSKVLLRVGHLWRAALLLAISEELSDPDDLEYTIAGDIVDDTQEERRQGVMERYDAFAAALQQIGLIGIWNEKPLADGRRIKRILPNIPKGPAFREVMDEQTSWMTVHPGAGLVHLEKHLRTRFSEYL